MMTKEPVQRITLPEIKVLIKSFRLHILITMLALYRWNFWWSTVIFFQTSCLGQRVLGKHKFGIMVQNASQKSYLTHSCGHWTAICELQTEPWVTHAV